MGPESSDERNAAAAAMSAEPNTSSWQTRNHDNGKDAGDEDDIIAAGASAGISRRPGLDELQRTVTAPVIPSSFSPAAAAEPSSPSLSRPSAATANYSSTRHTHASSSQRYALYTSASTTSSNSNSRSQEFRSAPPLSASHSDTLLEAFLDDGGTSRGGAGLSLGGGSFASGRDSPGRQSVVKFSEPMETPGVERRRRLQEGQLQRQANGHHERDAGNVSSGPDETTGILGADRNGNGTRSYQTTTGENGTGKRQEEVETETETETDAESRDTDEIARRIDAGPRSSRARESSLSSYASTVRSRRQGRGGGSTSRSGRTDGAGSGASGAGNANGNGNDAVVGAAEKGWWKRLAEHYGSVELDNKGSVARDHLALERTFLAWLRTSLSFASIGIAVTQLFRLNTSLSKPANPSDVHLRHVGKPLGATFIGVSIVILLIGFHRYFESQHYVIRGKFPASRGSVVMVSIIAAALIVTSLVVILAVAPKAVER